MLSATVVAPGHSKLVPLTPEFTAPQDGADKQDGEPRGQALVRQARRAAGVVATRVPGRQSVRLPPRRRNGARRRRRFHLHLQRRCTTSSRAPILRHEKKVRRRNGKETFRFRWIELVQLRDGKDAILVTWIGFEIVDTKGKVKYFKARVTSLPVSKDNVAEIVACGRARWKIENERFKRTEKPWL